MKKIILVLLLSCLIGLVLNACDCCDQCNDQQEPEQPEIYGDCPAIKYVFGGYSGSGHATRYWDCCKPSCSWAANSGSGNEARSCDISMNNVLSDYNTKSNCDGGQATTCLSQIPFTINGCDNYGFAFASVPAYGPNLCGKCFELSFTGQGKYETRKNHQMLSSKKLIVMATNIGWDVASNQFDILIPGGGVGYFDGCSKFWGSNLGAQYGGLLSDCENSVGYSYDDYTLYIKRKECLLNKCSSVFSSNPNAKKGCEFLANFMEAAGNPLITYRQVECPQVLLDKY